MANSQGRDDRSTRERGPQAIVVLGRDHHDRVLAMDRNALGLVVAGAANHLAETGLGVLQPPTITRAPCPLPGPHLRARSLSSDRQF